MSLAGNALSLNSVHPELKRGIEALMRLSGLAGARSIRITSARRSRAQQEALYARFKAGQSIYPVAVPGTSAHERGFAVDLVTEPMTALAELGAGWQALGGIWSPKDPIHFEIR